MAEYLVVAHQTAMSAELLQHLLHLSREDSSACFTLVVPATNPAHLLVWEPGDAVAIAQVKAKQAHELFQQQGLRVLSSQVGDASPVRAIEEELTRNPGVHSQVILCTLPPGVSHWLGVDAPTIAREQFEVPVVHIVGGSAYR